MKSLIILFVLLILSSYAQLRTSPRNITTNGKTSQRVESPKGEVLKLKENRENSLDSININVDSSGNTKIDQIQAQKGPKENEIKQNPRGNRYLASDSDLSGHEIISKYQEEKLINPKPGKESPFALINYKPQLIANNQPKPINSGPNQNEQPLALLNNNSNNPILPAIVNPIFTSFIPDTDGMSFAGSSLPLKTIQNFKNPHHISKNVMENEMRSEVLEYFVVHDYLDEDYSIPKIILHTTKGDMMIKFLENRRLIFSDEPYAVLEHIDGIDKRYQKIWKVEAPRLKVMEFFEKAKLACESSDYKKSLDYNDLETLLATKLRKKIDERGYLAELAKLVENTISISNPSKVDRLIILFRLLGIGLGHPYLVQAFQFYALRSFTIKKGHTELLSLFIYPTIPQPLYMRYYFPKNLNKKLTKNEVKFVIYSGGLYLFFDDKSQGKNKYLQVKIRIEKKKDSLKDKEMIGGHSTFASIEKNLEAVFIDQFKGALWGDLESFEEVVLNKKKPLLKKEKEFTHPLLFSSRLFKKLTSDKCPEDPFEMLIDALIRNTEYSILYTDTCLVKNKRKIK